ncbi:hypothetical protein [Paraburkholderia sp. Ac-20347]|uniref:hypothetical protein n=1 Tax=Paraburkholderia sp. Ac-20347 TaxID=2703892 RepID=UPI0019811081|nr:hypothetical protein [Paraburkholderia sp. Ac-20347]MBN3808884.1 hypothetical protein [Paraburkholderia sp. Ac-20347]
MSKLADYETFVTYRQSSIEMIFRGANGSCDAILLQWDRAVEFRRSFTDGPRPGSRKED